MNKAVTVSRKAMARKAMARKAMAGKVAKTEEAILQEALARAAGILPEVHLLQDHQVTDRHQVTTMELDHHQVNSVMEHSPMVPGMRPQRHRDIQLHQCMARMAAMEIAPRQRHQGGGTELQYQGRHLVAVNRHRQDHHPMAVAVAVKSEGMEAAITMDPHKSRLARRLAVAVVPRRRLPRAEAELHRMADGRLMQIGGIGQMLAAAL